MSGDDKAAIAGLADKHGVSKAAVEAALAALIRGNGRQAQFDHPDLGGLGQWSSGGMVMIGDMFDNGLKAKVARLFEDLLPLQGARPQSDGAGAAVSSSSPRWPAELGSPASTGSQNDMHYAIFPATKRIAVEEDGKLRIYALGSHRITGVGQQQSGTRSLRFTGPDGPVSLDDLEQVDLHGESDGVSPTHGIEPRTPAASADIEGRIGRLHDLLVRGALTQHEFDE
ncbi:MAG: hypothetical protein QM690_08690, partial [Sphingobium sp.]